MVGFFRIAPGLAWLDVCLLVLGIAWAFARLGIALLQREKGAVIFSLLGAVAMSGVGWFWWCEFEESRAFILAVPLVACCLGLLGNRSRRTLPLSIASLLLGVNYGLPVLLSRIPPYGMHQDDILAADSPDGAYRAIVVDRDGLTYGYDLLYLRPREAGLSTILDRPQREIAEFVQEMCVARLWWEGPRTLHVVSPPKTERVHSIDRWKGITIRYEIDPSLSAD